ncbi:MAG TPA: FecR domain-containing protein [Sphingobium sp.]
MTDAGPDIRDSAVAWHIAMPTMTEDRWHAFVEWLEADPAHASAYDAVTLADARLAQVPPAANVITLADRRPIYAMSRKPMWIGGALAASLAALFAVTTQLRGPQDQSYSVATPAGTTRTIAMGEGSAVTLNGGTRMAFDKANPRSASLTEGEALFSVHHDAKQPFEVALGRFRVVDLGTVFNIVRSKGRLSVAVSEGSVLFDPDGAHLTLQAGDAITVDETANIVTRAKAGNVGGWRNGEMEFSNAALGDVAEAIHRRTGAQIAVSALLSNTPFTGNVKITGDAARDARHLAQLIGADVRRDGEKWLLSPTRAAQ